MRTDFSAQLLATSQGARANEILRACVHCGFCNATCPTYQLTGDELDGPRGRIYLMRDLLQGSDDPGRATRHLDRCLTCRACETTCPSGVAYGELAEIARNHLGSERSGIQGRLRKLLQWMVPVPARLRAMARLGGSFRWFVPRRLAKNLPASVGVALAAESASATKVLVLNGCAQQVNTAATNVHLSQLLQTHGIGVMTIAEEVCCGGLDLHLGDDEAALDYIRRNVEALHPLLDEIDAVVSTASGCGVTVKDYGRLLEQDAQYAQRAAAVAAKTLDVSEYLASTGLAFEATEPGRSVAWHSPCTLQHGQRINGPVEQLLHNAGYQLTPVTDAHLCCGSAGTYSMLQPVLAEKLKLNKLAALTAGSPDIIATANVGCQTHIGSDAKVPVLHWIELLK